MKKIISMGLLLLMLPFSSAIADRGKVGTWNPTAPSPFNPPPSFEEILKDYRNTWIRLTSLEFSGLHWNQGIVVYINKHHKVFINNYIYYLQEIEGLSEYEDCDIEEDEDCETPFKTYPVGTIVLKENFALANGVPTAPLTVTLMRKRDPGYDPEAGDWEYVQYDPQGHLVLQGNTQNPAVKAACSECHENLASRDFIFSTFYTPQNAKRIPDK